MRCWPCFAPTREPPIYNQQIHFDRYLLIHLHNIAKGKRFCSLDRSLYLELMWIVNIFHTFKVKNYSSYKFPSHSNFAYL